jgi:hypothetical protein
MTDAEKNKLSIMFNKYRRYSDISCSMLSTLVHDGDSLDNVDTAPIVNVELRWLLPYVDGLVKIKEKPKDVDLTDLEINLMVIEVLIYIRSYTENEDLGMPEIIEMFEEEMYKSMSIYNLKYEFNPIYNINSMEVIIGLVNRELTRHDSMITVGWVNNIAMILAVVEGL